MFLIEKKVALLAEKCKAQNLIDEYYFVEYYIKQALEYFGISKEDLACGYYYSTSSLVGIFLCETEYLLHFTTDALDR